MLHPGCASYSGGISQDLFAKVTLLRYSNLSEIFICQRAVKCWYASIFMEGFSIETVSLLQVDRSAPHPKEVQLKFSVFPYPLLRDKSIVVQAWFLIQSECRENAVILRSTQQNRSTRSEFLCILGWTVSSLFEHFGKAIGKVLLWTALGILFMSLQNWELTLEQAQRSSKMI